MSRFRKAETNPSSFEEVSSSSIASNLFPDKRAAAHFELAVVVVNNKEKCWQWEQERNEWVALK